MQKPNIDSFALQTAEAAAGSQPNPDLGPDSLLWRYAGDMRICFTGLSAGLLQLMHPAIGSGVAEHSNFFGQPWQRIQGSLPWILGVVYDADPHETGRTIRSFHHHVKGTDTHQKPYHALQPETYWWAHATFQNMVEQTVDRYTNYDLNSTAKEQLYQEGKLWYSRYGMTLRPVPETYDSFKQTWDKICSEVLEITPAAEWALDMLIKRDIDRVPVVPSIIWKLFRKPASEIARLTTIGGLPKIVRDRFDIPWSSNDEKSIKRVESVIRNGWQFVHPRLRYHPRARAGCHRVSTLSQCDD